MFGNSQLDAYAAQLAAVPAVCLFGLDNAGRVFAYPPIPSAWLIERLTPSHANLRADWDLIATEIMHWGRMSSLQQRVVAVRERELRVWKAHRELEIREDPSVVGWGQGKRVSEEQVRVHYRTAPGYDAVQTAVEAAQEAAAYADVVYRAFQDKLAVLKADTRRLPDGTMQRMS